MGKASVPWNEVKQRMLQDPEVAAAYDELTPEYEIANQLIQARLERGLTQKELADKIGTRQGHISRMESGQQNISIGMLKRVAKALDKKVHVVIG